MYKLTAIQDDGSEVPISAKRLKLEIDPKRIVEIDLNATKRSCFTLACKMDSKQRTSLLVIHPCAANVIRVEVTPKS